MKTRTSTQIAAVITVALAVSIAYANGFEELYSVGSAGRLHEAAGAFVPVFDEDGNRTAEYVFLLQGGYQSELNPEPVSDVWVLADGYWQHMGNQAPAMASHGLQLAADGRAWALGGIGADDWLRPLNALTAFKVRRSYGRLEVEVESIHVSGPSPDARFGAATVAIDGGRSILHIGGASLGDPLHPAHGQLWEYGLDDNHWYRLTDLPTEISKHSAVSSRDFVWVFGGEDPNGLRNDILRYDVLTDEWSVVDVPGDLPESRRDHRAVAVGATMIVFGGIRTPFFPETLDDVWQFDLDALTWAKKSAMPSGLAGMVVDRIPPQPLTSAKAQVLIYGGVLDAWSFPLDLSDSTCIYTSDLETRHQRRAPHKHDPSIN